MKKLLSVILTVVIMVLVLYAPYRLSVEIGVFTPPCKETAITSVGPIWYVVLSIGYFVVNWFAGLGIIGAVVIGLTGVLAAGSLINSIAQDIYHGTLELLEAMEVKK